MHSTDIGGGGRALSSSIALLLLQRPIPTFWVNIHHQGVGDGPEGAAGRR